MNSAALPVGEHESSGWVAQLELEFEPRVSRTVLARRKQRGPLAVQRPFYPESEVCHLYLLHPPGGVVGGDRLEITADVQMGAAVVVTTPGATKFYRSGGRDAFQRQVLNVKAGGSLEWFPQENIFFPGTRVALETVVHLETEARFMGWEIQCLGRPANQERFNYGRLSLQLQIYREGTPLLLERLNVAGEAELSGAASLRSYPVSATFIASGVTTGIRDEVRESLVTRGDDLAAATLLDDLLIVRYLGVSTESARKLFVHLWSLLRPTLLKRAACPPRIWFT
ncbi:MAG: urease accessory protein UreD [Gemmatimonadetes bacterium]|nr:urease accessory protein UreD [Gemmatimonadota bacterium]